MRTSGPDMELALRTLRRVEELTQSLNVSINHKTLFVAGEEDAPWASFAVSHAAAEHQIFAASFDLDADVEGSAQGLAKLILGKLETGAGEKVVPDVS